MNEYKAIIIFILIVISAVALAVIGIMFNIKKAAKLFKDDEIQDEEETEEKTKNTHRQS